MICTVKKFKVIVVGTFELLLQEWCNKIKDMYTYTGALPEAVILNWEFTLSSGDMCCSRMGLGLFLFCLVIVSSSSGLFSVSFPPVSELPVNYRRGGTREKCYKVSEKS